MEVEAIIDNRKHFETFPNWTAACYFIKAIQPSEATLRVINDEDNEQK